MTTIGLCLTINDKIIFVIIKISFRYFQGVLFYILHLLLFFPTSFFNLLTVHLKVQEKKRVDVVRTLFR